MKKLNNYIYFNVTFAFFTFLNLYLSQLMVNKLSFGWSFNSSFINITYAENTGAAFSIMQNATNYLVFLSLVAIVLIFYYVMKNLELMKMKELFLVSFLVAGIAGNLYERLMFGHVRDFFDLAFMKFPIFNISDIFINIGVIGIIILILLAKKPIKM